MLSWEKFAEVFKHTLRAFGVDVASNCLLSGGEPASESVRFRASKVSVDFNCNGSWVRASAKDTLVRVQIESDERGCPYISMVSAAGGLEVGGCFKEFAVSGKGIKINDGRGNVVTVEFLRE